jgi:hypothetical protein
VSSQSLDSYRQDAELAERFDGLLAQARAAEEAFRDAQAARAGDAELFRLGKNLDEALTAVMRAAYATVRAKIGPRGYEDRIYRRKAMATPPVRAWRAEAERLLTLRETHRLNGLARVPRAGLRPGGGVAPGADPRAAGVSVPPAADPSAASGQAEGTAPAPGDAGEPLSRTGS